MRLLADRHTASVAQIVHRPSHHRFLHGHTNRRLNRGPLTGFPAPHARAPVPASRSNNNPKPVSGIPGCVATSLAMMAAAPPCCLQAHAALEAATMPSLLTSPLLAAGVQSANPNLWVQLGAIIAANVVVIQGVAKLFDKLRDKSNPVTLVKLQLGLISDSTHIRSRLAELSGMIKVGGKGVWIILEEALLEFAKYQNSCQLADVAAVQLASKSEAYDLFGEVAKSEVQRAQKGGAAAHLGGGQGECSVDWDGEEAKERVPALLQWLSGEPEQSGCDDALVVTLVVAARGDLEVPTTVNSWADLANVMKTLGGLSSERLMALDLTWSPSQDNEFLTREQLVQDYTNLKPIRR